jgi:hypothetical protein
MHVRLADYAAKLKPPFVLIAHFRTHHALQQLIVDPLSTSLAYRDEFIEATHHRRNADSINFYLRTMYRISQAPKDLPSA